MDGQLIQKKDCSAAVQAAMPEAKSLAQVRTRESGRGMGVSSRLLAHCPRAILGTNTTLPRVCAFVG